ncbi:MAG: hypothetical protein J7L26_06900 [Candidatus Aminicenantes bacterium]|nr:hypothetical protein [Candidatus Aminicenantes bacterium]
MEKDANHNNKPDNNPNNNPPKNPDTNPNYTANYTPHNTARNTPHHTAPNASSHNHSNTPHHNPPNPPSNPPNNPTGSTPNSNNKNYYKIDLMDYLAVLWRKKWIIIIPTFLFMLAALLLCFFLPKKWEVSAIIQPSKFLVQTGQGRFEEVLVASPGEVVGQINEEAYNQLIAQELGVDLGKFPKIKAKNLKNTNLVKVSLATSKIEEGKRILLSLFSHLKRDLDKKIDVEIQNIDTQKKELENKIKEKIISINDKKNDIEKMRNEIRKKQIAIKQQELEADSLEIEKKRLAKEIESIKNKIKVSEERVQSLTEEMKEVKKRVDDISEQQKKALAQAQEKGEAEALSLLLYANEIQENLKYYNTLAERISQEKLLQEDLKFSIKDKEELIKKLDNDIKNLQLQKENIQLEIKDLITNIKIVENEIAKIESEIETLKSKIVLLEDKKNRIDYARLIKDPTASIYPVSPQKKLIIVITAIVSFLCFTFLAFFIDYIERNKSRLE